MSLKSHTSSTTGVDRASTDYSRTDTVQKRHVFVAVECDEDGVLEAWDDVQGQWVFGYILAKGDNSSYNCDYKWVDERGATQFCGGDHPFDNHKCQICTSTLRHHRKKAIDAGQKDAERLPKTCVSHCTIEHECSKCNGTGHSGFNCPRDGGDADVEPYHVPIDVVYEDPRYSEAGWSKEHREVASIVSKFHGGGKQFGGGGGHKSFVSRPPRDGDEVKTTNSSGLGAATVSTPVASAAAAAPAAPPMSAAPTTATVSIARPVRALSVSPSNPPSEALITTTETKKALPTPAIVATSSLFDKLFELCPDAKVLAMANGVQRVIKLGLDHSTHILEDCEELTELIHDKMIPQSSIIVEHDVVIELSKFKGALRHAEKQRARAIAAQGQFTPLESFDSETMMPPAGGVDVAPVTVMA